MKKHVFPIALIAASIMMWGIFFNELPSTVPIHWGISGEANGFASRTNAMLFSIGIMVFLYLVLYFIPRMDPKKENYEKFSKGFAIINIATMLLFFGVNVLMIMYALGYDINMEIWILILVGASFVVLGNYMPQIKPNYFVGIKTPWTLNDETVWKKTHRFGGKVFMICGVLFMVSVLLPQPYKEPLLMPGILILLLSPVAYSYLLYKKTLKG